MMRWAIGFQLADLLTFYLATHLWGFSGEYGFGAGQAFAVAGLFGVTVMKVAGVLTYLWVARVKLASVVLQPFGFRLVSFKSLLFGIAIVMGALGTIVNTMSIGVAL